MRKVLLEVTIDADVSDETEKSIIGNIIEHVDHENKFWSEEEMIGEDEEVFAVVIEDPQ